MSSNDNKAWQFKNNILPEEGIGKVQWNKLDALVEDIELTGCKTRNDGVHGVWRYSNPNSLGSDWTETNTKVWDSICSWGAPIDDCVSGTLNNHHLYKRCAWYPEGDKGPPVDNKDKQTRKGWDINGNSITGLYGCKTRDDGKHGVYRFDNNHARGDWGDNNKTTGYVNNTEVWDKLCSKVPKSSCGNNPNHRCSWYGNHETTDSLSTVDGSGAGAVDAWAFSSAGLIAVQDPLNYWWEKLDTNTENVPLLGCKTRNDGEHGVRRYDNPDASYPWNKKNTQIWDSYCNLVKDKNKCGKNPNHRCAWYEPKKPQSCYEAYSTGGSCPEGYGWKSPLYYLADLKCSSNKCNVNTVDKNTCCEQQAPAPKEPSIQAMTTFFNTSTWLPELFTL